MAVVAPGPPTLTTTAADNLSLFRTTDPLLANAPVLIFYGPAASLGATSSRVQIHIFTAAGIGSYVRLAISPNSPFYSAVTNLPREEQGDEVCRGVAFGLKRFFNELPQNVKDAWCAHARAPSASLLFGDDHVAILATRMVRVENIDEVAGVLGQVFGEQRLSWQEIDVVLPNGSIKEAPAGSEALDSLDAIELAAALEQRYRLYADVVRSLGDTCFLPTSRFKRAPSKASSIGKSSAFSEEHRDAIRHEIQELSDTEMSYVERLRDLQKIASTIGPDLKESAKQELRKAFPVSVDSILEVNMQLLDQLRLIVGSFPDGQCLDDGSIAGAAKALRDSISRFAAPYSDYLASQADATQALRSCFKSTDTALTGALQEIGEQKLISLLMEPVQRLPRYNLYIDAITKRLPARHAAIKYFLTARDSISEICAGENSATTTRTLEKLHSRIGGWPSDLIPSGRLVNAVDFVELNPPYVLEGADGQHGMLLLFNGCIILLEKSPGCGVTARSLLTELESGITTQAETTPQTLHFANIIQLSSVTFTEAYAGRALNLFLQSEAPQQAHAKEFPAIEACISLRLETSYEGKASKLMEDIMKARIEGRFSEAEREAAKWELRASDPIADHFSLFSAIYEDSSVDHVQARTGAAPTRILIDIDRHSHRPRAGQNGLQTMMALSPLKDGQWRLTTECVDGSSFREVVEAADLALTVSKRLASVSMARHSIHDSSMTACLLTRNTDALQQIDLDVRPADETGPDGEARPSSPERPRRSRSPVKLLSHFLSSTGPSTPTPMSLKNLPPLPTPSGIPRVSSKLPPSSRPTSSDSRPGSKDAPAPLSPSRTRPADPSRNVNGRVCKLEDILSAYVLALQARKGNVVGRSLNMRAMADELAVNELYNSLLEDSNAMVHAAHASVDVLFAAFEKFLKVAWQEQLGPVISTRVLQEIQAKAETLFPVDFDAYFKTVLSGLAPQNQEAFKNIMKLLADLLDGTGNDSDRGMLTAAFADILVADGQSREYIALIDRLVDDPDTYFGEPLEDAQNASKKSELAHKRARSVNSASITSNTSSLRRKFGFSIGRSNSKVEDESKVAAVWRSLSKNARGGDVSPGGSITKPILSRAQSIDLGAKRPSSQDGPSTLRVPGADDHNLNRSTSSATSQHGLTTIGEHLTSTPSGRPRKKRRSSLSDIFGLDESVDISFNSPASRRPTLMRKISDEDYVLPSLDFASNPSSKDQSHIPSPTRETPRARLPASFRREKSPGPAKAFETPEILNSREMRRPEEVVITANPTSSIPTLTPRGIIPAKSTSTVAPRNGLSERAGAGNIVKRPASPSKLSYTTKTPGGTPVTSPKKLRMHSPQKLRERLQNEEAVVSTTASSLRDQLSKLGEELLDTSGVNGSIQASRLTGGENQKSHMTGSTDLIQRISNMESALPTAIDELNGNICELRVDLNMSLAVSETKCKKLDELYRDANSENEALYNRFNDELGRILKAVKGGEGIEELKKKWKESQDEAMMLRRENSRLKREIVGLRAQLKE